MSFAGWNVVANNLDKLVSSQERSNFNLLDSGQLDSVAEIAHRIRCGKRALLIADEVGMGKTRIAAALIEAVRSAGGRSTVILPAGLGVQWQSEIRQFNAEDKTLLPLRSYESFISAYFNEEDKSSRRHLDRRIGRELPENGWHNEPVILISQNFANMRFPKIDENKQLGWRRLLLPSINHCLHNHEESENPSPTDNEYVTATHLVARHIANVLRLTRNSLSREETKTDMESSDYRERLLPYIGNALGDFDLAIIDEAHKARGHESSLSRVLDKLLSKAPDVFRLGMTATPVELEARQWVDTLQRIGVNCEGQDKNATGSDEIKNIVEAYVKCVSRLQNETLDNELVGEFEKTANQFSKKLRPHVLRRDKRDDKEISNFVEKYGDYRRIEDVEVPLNASINDKDSSHFWLRRYCAAEALSFMNVTDRRLKVLRLSMAQGHTPDFIINDDQKLENYEHHEHKHTDHKAESSKKLHEEVWLDAFGSQHTSQDIYTHPALLAAVKKIESYTSSGEKVLVFGNYIKPLQALTRLLDAREMLRRLSDGQHWPAQKVTDRNHDAVLSAIQDFKLQTCFTSLEDVNAHLAENYKIWRKKRQSELGDIHKQINHLAKKNPTAKMLSDFWQDISDSNFDDHIAPLLEALNTRRETDSTESQSAEDLVQGFKSLIAELSNGEDAETNTIPTERLHNYLQDYSGREGSFARLMFGDTKPQTRRLLQSAFNRKGAWPKVLLAQSLVGREGLNLHEECSTVVLLHAEWNPGVIEQQIGRVDRKNSHWLKKMREWAEACKGATISPDDPNIPRINIHSIIMRGTYDDYHWQTLKTRWKDLRAQLHGDVLPHLHDSICQHSSEKAELIKRVRANTPNFRPKKLQWTLKPYT